MDFSQMITAILIAAAVALFCGAVKAVCKKYSEGGVKRHDDQ